MWPKPRGWNLRVVTLECRHCGRTKRSWPDRSDPPNTAKVVSTCDQCPEDAAIVDYYDKDGRQIDDQGNPMAQPDA